MIKERPLFPKDRMDANPGYLPIFTIIILLVLLAFSCATQSGNSINPIYFTDQVEIDGCEYIVINGANGRDIEHKFNCKNIEHCEEQMD